MAPSRGSNTKATEQSRIVSSKSGLKGGRPMKRASDLRPSRRIINQSLKRYQRHLQRITKREQRKLSPLESLPIELIQQIFFHSLEVNLARASPSLSSALSNDSIYNALVYFAYFDDDGESPVETQYFLPAEYRKLQLIEKVQIQQGILGCRWCDLNKIKSCMPTLCRLQITQVAYRERQSELVRLLHSPTTVNQELDSVGQDPWFQKISKLPPSTDYEALEAHFMAKSYVRPSREVSDNREPQESCIVSSNEHLPRIQTWCIIQNSDGSSHKICSQPVSILAVRHIPDWMLRGNPWTPQKLEFLQLLRQGHGFIRDERVISISKDALSEGMASAIKGHNIKALTTLLEIRSSIFQLPETSGGAPERRLIPESLHMLSVDLFHLAIKQGSHADGLMSLLIRGAVDQIPEDDDFLTAWVIRGQTKGSSIARWLSAFMDVADDASAYSGRHLFSHGMLLSPLPPLSSIDAFPEATFADDLNYVPEMYCDNSLIIPKRVRQFGHTNVTTELQR